jgi:hypothetical protein
MKLPAILLFGFGVLLLAAGLHAQVTIEQVAADPKLWPHEIKLTRAVPLQLFENGRPTGSVQGNAGLALQLRRVEANRLTVMIGTAAAVVAPAATDILTRIPAGTGTATAPASNNPETAANAAATSPSPSGAAPASHIQSFRAGWKMPRGKWTVTGDTEIEQHDNKDGCTNAYMPLPQSGKMEYRVKEKYYGGKSACTTIYIMCDDGEKTERGNAYLIVDGLNEKGHADMTIVKVTDDKTKEMKKFPSTPVNGQWIDLRIVYDTASGTIDLTRNGQAIGSWTDPDPIKTGKDYSIGTCMTKASFRDIEVRALP